MPSFLVVYRPLILKPAGRAAAERFELPPFIDGSCRREPDFESVYPSISALCRAAMFAPRLRVGDTAVYLATKSSYPDQRGRQRRLTAVLRVQERFASHEEAAAWYRAEGVPLPSNCWVAGNPPIPYEQTVQDQDPAIWDRGYRARARRWPVFLASQPIFLELHNPPVVTDEMIESAFGRVPSMLTPPKVSDDGVARLMGLCGVPA